MTMKSGLTTPSQPYPTNERARPGDVVVAVGDADATPSLRYAVEEARTRKAGLLLVHVLRVQSADLGIADELEQATTRAWALLSSAAAVARELGAEIPVSTHLARHGTIADAIAAQSAEAAVTVVQHRHLGRVRRTFTHSITKAVAAHAGAPVVAVPDSWEPDALASPRSVVVGVQDLDDARPLIARAVAESERRDLPLRVVHAGVLGSRITAGIAVVVQEARRAHPTVSIESLTVEAGTETLLTTQAGDAEVLVLGRRSGLRPGTHLGPVARALLDRADCPVMLVRTGTADTPSGS